MMIGFVGGGERGMIREVHCRRERVSKRAESMRARCFECGVIQWNSNTKSIMRGVYIGIVTVVREDLMVFGERKTKDKIKRGSHNSNCWVKVKRDRSIVRGQSRNSKIKVMYNMSD